MRFKVGDKVIVQKPEMYKGIRGTVTAIKGDVLTVADNSGDTRRCGERHLRKAPIRRAPAPDDGATPEAGAEDADGWTGYFAKLDAEQKGSE